MTHEEIVTKHMQRLASKLMCVLGYIRANGTTMSKDEAEQYVEQAIEFLHVEYGVEVSNDE